MVRIFGEIPGQPAGSEYANREALSRAGVHKPLQAGISGASSEGADSIVVNGGYEDDEDYGDLIIYTGAGGRDPGKGHQIKHQDFVLVNAALAKSCIDGRLVRVVRGAGTSRDYSPKTGYRYDGLYRVVDFWLEIGRSGFRVCRFRLIKADQDSVSTSVVTASERRKALVQRIVRNTEKVRLVKEKHCFQCQICATTIRTPAGFYAEGAHIRPLGRPHDGPDTEENILCLCPNDHVKLDNLAITVLDNLCVIDTISKRQIGSLKEVSGHHISKEHLAYHRRLCGLQ